MAVLDPYVPVLGNLGVALINSVGLVVVGFWAYVAKKNSKAAVTQLENEHGESENPNLRDNIDANEQARIESDRKLNSKVDRVITDMHVLKDDVSSVKDDVSDLREHADLLQDGYASNRSRIKSLEDTESRRRDEEYWGPQPQTRRERRENGHG